MRGARKNETPPRNKVPAIDGKYGAYEERSSEWNCPSERDEQVHVKVCQIMTYEMIHLMSKFAKQ